MKVLIIGNSGFLGASLQIYFLQKKVEFHTLSRRGVSTYNLDISEYDNFNQLPLNFFNVIINCATILPGGDYLDNHYLDDIYNTNIKGTQNICKWLNGQTTVTQIINCSSLSIYKKPLLSNSNEDSVIYPVGKHVLYTSSKLMQELIFSSFVEEKKIKLCQIRFSALYGKNMPSSGILHNLLSQIRKTKLIELQNGNMVSFDFLNVKNASEIVFSVMTNGFNGILHGASGNEIFLYDLAKLVISKFDNNVTVNNVETEHCTINRMSINVDLLNSMLNVSRFIPLQVGLDELIN